MVGNIALILFRLGHPLLRPSKETAGDLIHMSIIAGVHAIFCGKRHTFDLNYLWLYLLVATLY